MPARPPKVCRAPGCRSGTTNRNGYCDKHQHLHQPWERKKINSRSGRGGRPWRRKREARLKKDNYLCQPCFRAGRITPATEVDHIVPLAEGGTDDESNLESTCSPCHKKKTQAESLRGRSR